MRWRKRESSPEAEEEEEDPNAGLSEADVQDLAAQRQDSVEAAGALLDGPTATVKPEEAAPTPTPEYDVGDVDVDALLDDGPVEPSIDHSELNVVVHADLDELADPLADAPIVGDLPVEIEFENEDE